METQLGRSFDAQISLAMPACKGAAGQAALSDLAIRLEPGSGPFELRVRAVQASAINAFALPGGQILVTDDLIKATRTPAELSAVIAHEVGHVERRHVMQAVWRQLGAGLLLDALVGGGSGAGQQIVLLSGSIANLSYGRRAETEADADGRALLKSAGLSSQGMASFFDRMGSRRSGIGEQPWGALLSDHPPTVERARLARRDGAPGAVAFTPEQWAAVKETCGNEKGPREKLPRA
jgi:predicted Zn-dependent protease